MSFSEIYVDPSIAADSGTGTIGDPYGDLEYAIEQATFGADGTRINIKAGTSEVLAVELATAISAALVTPTYDNPLIFQGYTSAANDGGVGSISGGGLVSIISDNTLNHVNFVDLELTNAGANVLIDLNDYCSFIRCHIHGCTGNNTLVQADVGLHVIDSYLHDCESRAISCTSNHRILNNYIEDFGNTNDSAIVNNSAGLVMNNIIVVPVGGSGIELYLGGVCINNSIYSDGAGTGFGIELNAATISGGVVANNLIEGFSGTGGAGIVFESGSATCIYYDGNSVYNCETEYSVGAGIYIYGNADNETLTASPFSSPSTGDFSPVDTGSVKEGSLPGRIGGGFI